MNSELTGQGRLRKRLIRAAEGPVILLLLLAVSFLMSGLSDRQQCLESFHVLLLIGGVALILIALPPKIFPRGMLRVIPRLIGVSLLALGFLLLLFSDTLLGQEVSNELRRLARPLAAGGGLCFLIVWLSLLHRPPPGETLGQNRLLTNGSFLFAAASFLSLSSSPWDILWWFRYLLLLCAYLLCSLFLLNSCRGARKKSREDHEGLEETEKKLADVLENSRKRIAYPSDFSRELHGRNGQGSRGIGPVQSDITDQKDLEYQLQLDRKILENAEEAVVITDADALIVDINTAYTRITGYEPREIIGENPRVCKSGHHDQAFYERMWKELLGTGKWSGEIWDRRKNGEIYQKWLTINAIYDYTGETINYVGIFTDISDVTRAPEPEIMGRNTLVLKAKNVEELMFYTTDDE